MTTPDGGRGAWLVNALILAIPLLVIVLYWLLAFSPSRPSIPEPAREQGPTPSASSSAIPPTSPSTPQREAVQAPGMDAGIEQMAQRLAARLEREPGDANGWRTLARTYYVMERFAQAVAAYEKLAALAPLDADVLADYADAAAMAQGRTLAGKPMGLVRRALEQNPSQWKALSMAATDAYQRNDVRAAIGYWERALAAVPPDSPMAESIRGSLAQARQAIGVAAPTSPATPASPSAPTSPAAPGTAK